jgi:hypothetical protein
MPAGDAVHGAPEPENFEGDLELRRSCNPGATLNDFSRLTLNALRDVSLIF